MKFLELFRKRTIERRHTVRCDPEQDTRFEAMRCELDDKIKGLAMAGEDLRSAGKAFVTAVLGDGCGPQKQQSYAPERRLRNHG